MTRRRRGTYWAAQWVSVNRLDGRRSHLVHADLVPVLFATRREARAYIEDQFGYIRERPDLQREPHGWRMPRAVLVTVEAPA